MPEGLSPTAAAAAIKPLAEEAERSVRAIEREVGSSDRRVEGQVRLATSEAFSGYIVRHLPRLQALHPGLTVEILTGNRILDLTRGEADVAVRMVPTTQPELICRRVGTVGWSLFASEAYIAMRGVPRSPLDLSGHEVIGFDESLAGSPGARWLETHGKGAHIPLRGNSIGAVIKAAAIGIGLAMVPCYLAAAEPALRRVAPGMLSLREVWLVFQPDSARVARVRAVVDFMAETIAADSAILAGALAT